jgi:hypothetical protein
MEIGAADAARERPHEHLPGLGFGLVDFLQGDLVVEGDRRAHRRSVTNRRRRRA